jgi:hypothetical protein
MGSGLANEAALCSNLQQPKYLQRGAGMTAPVDAQKLQGALRALGEHVIACVRAFRASGRLAIRRQQYVVRPDFTLWYSVDPTVLNFEIGTAEEDVWDWKDLEAFLANHIATHPAHANVIQILQDSAGDVNLVPRFASRVAYDAALNSGPELDQHIAAMLRDATGSPHKYHVRVWLTGITLSEGVVQVSDSLSLRRPTREDLQERVRVEDVQSAHAGLPGRVFFSCIADCEISARQPAECQRFVDRLITTLRLFRLGSVSAARYDYRAESFSLFASASFGGGQRAPRLAYTLSPDDRPRLLSALRVLMPLLPSIYDVPEAKPNFLSTALDWYSQSLLAGGPVEGTVAWAVACLEALFLGDNPGTELSYRLAHRVIALLRCFGWAPLEIRNVLRAAYDVRSRHVHGAVPKKLSQEELGTLHRNLAEYARASCLVWPQILLDKRRNDLLATLEESLIDDAARLRLQQWCNKVDFVRTP